MKRLLFALPVIALSTTALAESTGTSPYTLDPGPHAGDYEVTLSGVGQSDSGFDDTDFAFAGSIGYYFSKNILVTFKQAAGFDDRGNSTQVNGRSIFQAAYQWDLAKWQPYLGVNLGGQYGAGLEDDGVFGPEGGLKYYVNESTFVFGSVGYETPMQHCCNDGTIPYRLGVGFNF